MIDDDEKNDEHTNRLSLSLKRVHGCRVARFEKRKRLGAVHANYAFTYGRTSAQGTQCPRISTAFLKEWRWALDQPANSSRGGRSIG